MSPIFIAIVTAMAGIIGISSYYYLGPDHPVEEVAEAVIKDETGIDVNLSPECAKPAPADKITPVPSTIDPTPPTVASA